MWDLQDQTFAAFYEFDLSTKLIMSTGFPRLWLGAFWAS